MNPTVRTSVISIVILIVVAVAAYAFAIRGIGSRAPTSMTTSTSTPSATQLIPSLAVSGDYTIREIPVSGQTTAPEESTLLAQAATAQQKGDFKGAERILLSAAGYYPTDPTVYNNLAYLYLTDLKQYQQAAADYQKVVSLDPHDVNAYTMLFAIYSEKLFVPSATAAEDILKQGIAANPKAIDLQVELARHYKSLGRTADAKAEYDTAIANANAQGQTQLTAQLTAEENQ